MQFVANEENEDGAERGKKQAGGVISRICRTGKHVSDRAANDRTDDAEGDCPKNRHVNVHDRFRDNSGNQSDKNVPDQVKHNSLLRLLAESGRVWPDVFRLARLLTNPKAVSQRRPTIV